MRRDHSQPIQTELGQIETLRQPVPHIAAMVSRWISTVSRLFQSLKIANTKASLWKNRRQTYDLPNPFRTAPLVLKSEG